MKRASLVIGLCSTLLLCASCFEQEADNLSASGSNRTLLFCLIGDNGLTGDNSLAGEVQQKIDALTAAWSHSADGHLLVYCDRGASPAPCLLEIVTDADGTNRIDTLLKYPDHSSAASYTFRQILSDAYYRYPTSDFGLVVSSPMSGWLPATTLAVPRSAAPASRSIITDGWNELDLRDFADAIPDRMCRFILFEGGLMAGLEVTYELKDKTDYIVASAAEVLPPGFTPLYGELLSHLFKGEPELKEIAKLYFDRCNAQQGDQCSATISVIKTVELEPFRKLLAAAEKRVEHWEWIDRTPIQTFDCGPRYKEHLFCDASSYIRQIGSPEESAAFDEALQRAVIYQAATPEFTPGTGARFAINAHCGLTLYIPYARFYHLNEQRVKLKLFQ